MSNPRKREDETPSKASTSTTRAVHAISSAPEELSEESLKRWKRHDKDAPASKSFPEDSFTAGN